MAQPADAHSVLDAISELRPSGPKDASESTVQAALAPGRGSHEGKRPT